MSDERKTYPQAIAWLGNNLTDKQLNGLVDGSMVIVPEEPTGEMVTAGKCVHIDAVNGSQDPAEIYKAMIGENK